MTINTQSSMRTSCLVLLFIHLCLVALPGGIFACTPAFAVLEPISQHGYSLDDIAFSPTNTLYAIDSSKNQIVVYGLDGEIAGKMSVERPTAIAVSDSAIYVGSSNDFSVAILDLTGQLIGYLGQGAHEFRLPRNIAIDHETNDIYVVDQLDHSIKVYAHDGRFLRRVDDSPNLPQDVTVVGDEIFVLDQPLMTDAYGDQIRGARVSVFDKSGNLVSSFGTYGAGDGEFVRPKAMASDPQRGICISDAFNGSVLWFGLDGNYQQSVRDPGSPLIGAMGLAIDQTGRLLVSSPLSGRMNVFLLD